MNDELFNDLMQSIDEMQMYRDGKLTSADVDVVTIYATNNR